VEYDWVPHPVLHFSFNSFGHKVTHLSRSISYELERNAQKFAIDLPFEGIADNFKHLVQKIAEKENKPVVLLVDEYDKPIVDFITDHEQAKENQKVLRAFFSPLKELEFQGHLRFLFVTGVSKFSKVSLFSDLNNLTDLTLSPQANDLTGITQQELLENFEEYLEKGAMELKVSREKLLELIQLWYNGYTFDGETRLYNPFSLLSFFLQFRFRNFWFATGTPTFLIEMVRKEWINPLELEHKKVPESFFDSFSIKNLDFTGLLYQTGYLTIKEAITHPISFDMDYTLGYPNREVRKAFVYNLVQAYTYQPKSTVGTALLNMRDGLQTGDLDLFFENLNILLSDLSYLHQPKVHKNGNAKAKLMQMWEGYFHTIIYLVTAFLGMEVQSEITKHKGRLDLVAETQEYLYLMEFKLDEPVKDAIEQIKNRQYAASFQNTPKKLVLVGVGFSKDERTVQDWESEFIKPASR
ncbi:MAG: AAA family ATPase, partial [Bacteroidota bacterium]